MLAIEYQFVRIFINSLGMQAVVERTLDEADDFSSSNDHAPNHHHHPIRPLSVDSTDYHFIQEVVDGSCEILRKVIKLADAQRLRFAPVRIYLHITASAIYLIKGLIKGTSGESVGGVWWTVEPRQTPDSRAMLQLQRMLSQRCLQMR